MQLKRIKYKPQCGTEPQAEPEHEWMRFIELTEKAERIAVKACIHCGYETYRTEKQ